jgi:two-component system, LytTR family, response regulator
LTENRKIRVLIVDDEPLGRAMVHRMLEAHPEVEIVGVCENGGEAVAAVEAKAPDLIFLDVQMPEIDGFGVLKNLKENRPVIIFVTAYDEYAVRAFEVNALDYLLKPYDRKRFEQAFARAVQQINNQKRDTVGEQILSLLAETKSSEKYIERFIIKAGGRVFFLKAEEIFWISAEGNYVLIHTPQKKHIFREAISNLEKKLDPQKFRRISRSAIVNLDFVRELQSWFRGDYKVLLQDGTELKLSHRYRQNLTQYFGGSL